MCRVKLLTSYIAKIGRVFVQSVNYLTIMYSETFRLKPRPPEIHFGSRYPVMKVDTKTSIQIAVLILPGPVALVLRGVRWVV